MKLRLPGGFLEALFSNDTFTVHVEQHIDSIKVKSSFTNTTEMPNISAKIQEILTKHTAEIKEAYYTDLNSKFPARLSINLKTLEVLLKVKNHNYPTHNPYLTSVFKDALSTYTFRNQLSKSGRGIGELISQYAKILEPFFQQHSWKFHMEDKYEMWSIEVKDANKLQIIFSQILHLMEADTSLDQHLVKNWKDFFNA